MTRAAMFIIFSYLITKACFEITVTASGSVSTLHKTTMEMYLLLSIVFRCSAIFTGDLRVVTG